MFSARITLLVLLITFIVFQHADARRRRRCPRRDCEVSYWSSWSSCSANSCGQRGHQSRSRMITSHSSCGGTACPSSLDETRQCYSSTPVNCQLCSWSEWNACTTTSCHESGTQLSSRFRLTTEQCGGTCTSIFRKIRTCSRTSVDCRLSSWSEWSACVNTSTCDLSGIQSSTRDKMVEEKCGGRCSSSLQKTRKCFAAGTPSLPVDCQLSSWSEWSACVNTSTCDLSGIQSSTRHKMVEEKCGGRCSFSLQKTRKCFAAGTPSLPVDCQLGSWSEWSACTLTTCNVSSDIQFSTRHKIINENCGGTCTSMLRKTKSCTSNFSCQNGGSLKGGRCFCTKGFSGVCCEKADSSSQGMYSQY